MLSEDGAFVAFETRATNLVAGDSDRYSDVVVRDRSTGRNVLASIDERGRKLGTHVYLDGLSRDGRRVVFETQGGKIYWRNLSARRPILIGTGRSAALSPDGYHIAYLTTYDHVVAVNVRKGSHERIGKVLRSFDENPSRMYAPSLSNDGSQIAYVGRDREGRQAIVIYQPTTPPGDDILVRPPLPPDGRPGWLANAVVSGDGRRVAFQQAYECIQTLPPCASVWIADVRQDAEVTAVSVDRSGKTVYDFGSDTQPSINGDGSRVSFVWRGSALVDGDTNGCRSDAGDPVCADIFVRNVAHGVTTRASVSSRGRQANATCHYTAISGDSTVVAFACDATNLVPQDTNGLRDVFVRDLDESVTGRADVATR